MDAALRRFCSLLASLGWRPFAEDKWITVHPNGKRNKGQHIEIDDATGAIKSGMGGKYKGQKLSEVKAGFVGPKVDHLAPKPEPKPEPKPAKPKDGGSASASKASAQGLAPSPPAMTSSSAFAPASAGSQPQPSQAPQPASAPAMQASEASALSASPDKVAKAQEVLADIDALGKKMIPFVKQAHTAFNVSKQLAYATKGQAIAKQIEAEAEKLKDTWISAGDVNKINGAEPGKGSGSLAKMKGLPAEIDGEGLYIKPDAKFKHCAGWETLPKDQASAFLRYAKGDGDVMINGPLNYGTPMDGSSKKAVGLMDKAFQTAYPTDKDMVVYRGVSGAAALGWYNDIQQGRLKVGDSFSPTPGFMSTSADPSVSEKYSGKLSGSPDGVFMRIAMPKGSQAISVNGLVDGEEHLKEIVLPRGASLKVAGIEVQEKNGKRFTYLDAVLEPAGPSAPNPVSKPALAPASAPKPASAPASAASYAKPKLKADAPVSYPSAPNGFKPFSSSSVNVYSWQYGSAPRYEKTQPAIPQKDVSHPAVVTNRASSLASEYGKLSAPQKLAALNDIKSGIEKSIAKGGYMGASELKEKATVMAALEGHSGSALQARAEAIYHDAMEKQKPYRFHQDGFDDADPASIGGKMKAASLKGLSADQKKALRFYSAIGHPANSTRINEALRQGATMNAEASASIKELDKAFEKARTAKQMTVYRGISPDTLGKFLGPQMHAQLLKDGTLPVGARLTDHGFVSTSADRDVADTFASGQQGKVYAGEYAPPPKNGRAIVNVRVPKGSRAIAIPKPVHDQKEIVLDRSSSFRIVGATKKTDKNNKIYYEIDVEYEDQ